MKRVRALCVPVVCLLLFACSGPYIVTRELRGQKNDTIYYVYPPGTEPWRRVRVAETIPRDQSDQCAAVTASSESFVLTFRNAAWRTPAAVITDKGRLPKTRDDFKNEIDALQAGAGDCLQPAVAASLRAKLWERMPRTFADDLLTRYGYDTLNPKIDLEPGMRLRFEWESFTIPDRTDPELSSYVGTGTSFLMVAERPHNVQEGVTTEPGLLTFEPFLGWTNIGVDRRTRPHIAGAVDLEGSSRARRYYRLLIPLELERSAVPSKRLDRRFVLIGAATREDLDAAENDLDSCSGDVPADRPICTPVAGRTMVVPEVQIEVDGENVFLPVGTTLRQLIDRGGRPWTPRTFVPLRRWWRGRRVAVVFRDPDEDALHLPLMKGDRFRW